MPQIIDDGYLAFVDFLNRQSEQVGAAVLPAQDDEGNVLVIFAGNLERFAMLSVARHVRCKIIYLQDVESWWYQGSSLLPHLDLLSKGFLAEEIGSLQPLFFGQSSGGYASLVAGAAFSNSRVIACAPQVASDRAVKDAIISSHRIAVRCTPEALTNVPELWQDLAGSGPEAAIIFSASEWGNPIDSHLWMDYAHCLRMLGIPGVSVFMMANNVHAVVHRNADAFANLLGWLLATGLSIPSAADQIINALDHMSEKPEAQSPHVLVSDPECGIGIS